MEFLNRFFELNFLSIFGIIFFESIFLLENLNRIFGQAFESHFSNQGFFEFLNVLTDFFYRNIESIFFFIEFLNQNFESNFLLKNSYQIF